MDAVIICKSKSLFYDNTYAELVQASAATVRSVSYTHLDVYKRQVVLHLHRTCARSGHDFVVRGAPPQPMRVFEAAGLPQVMIFERGE